MTTNAKMECHDGFENLILTYSRRYFTLSYFVRTIQGYFTLAHYRLFYFRLF
jgi:hypothetical protein